MLNSKEEFEALTATLNSSGWSIYKRMMQEDMRVHFEKAKKSDNKDELFAEMQNYKILEKAIKKPYQILDESNYNIGDN